MDLPVLDKFCFAFDLKVGCITMGFTNAVLSLAMALVLLSFAADLKTSSDLISAKLSESYKYDDNMASVVYTIVIFMVILLSIKIVLDFFLAFAVLKDMKKMISKYCIFWIIFLVLFSIGFLKTLFHMHAGQVIAQIIFLVENFYFIVVIRSYLITLNDNGLQ